MVIHLDNVFNKSMYGEMLSFRVEDLTLWNLTRVNNTYCFSNAFVYFAEHKISPLFYL